MYLAINKQDNQDVHSFTWTYDDKLIINGNEVNPNDWKIVEVGFLTEINVQERRNRDTMWGRDETEIRQK